MLVLIMRGCSGMGKSTLARALAKALGNARIVSADDYFVNEHGEYEFDFKERDLAHDECMRQFLDALESGEHEVVIVDNTHTVRGEYTPYSAVARARGARVVLVHKCFDRAWLGRNVHEVPRHSVEAQYARWENPLSHHPPEVLVRGDQAAELVLEEIQDLIAS